MIIAAPSADRYRGDPPELEDVDLVTDIRRLCVDRPLISNTWAEFGVAGGDSARALLPYLPTDGRFYLFDSFEGMPAPWIHKNYGKTDQWAAKGMPTFSDKRVVIKKGWFKDTLPLDDLLGFVHIDCDLGSSTETVLNNINVTTGTILLFDELWGYDGYEEHEYKALMNWGRPFKFIARGSNFRAAIELL